MKHWYSPRHALAVAGTGISRESRPEFLWELVSCWLLAVGTALLQNVQLAYPISIWAILLQTAATIAVLALFSRRWFVLLITTIQLLLLGLLALVLFQLPVGRLLTSAGEFFRWWFAGMPEDSPWFTENGMMWVHILLNIGIGCLMFFVVRVSRNAVPPLVLCTAILIAVMALGETDNNAAAAAAYLAGCFPLISRDYYSGRRVFSGTEKYRPIGNRGGVATAAGVLSITVAAVLLLALPRNTVNIRTRWCSRVTADVQTLLDWFTTEQRAIDHITLQDLGLQTYNTRVGGDLEEREAAVVAVTDSDASAFLRVTTYDTYTGLLWKNRFDTAYRMNGPWKKTQTATLSNRLLLKRQGLGQLDLLTDVRTMTVTLRQESVFLPTTGQTLSFTENTVTKNPVVYNRNNEVFSFFGLPEGYSYTLETLTYPVTEAPSEQTLALLDEFRRAGEDPLYDDNEWLDHYLELPENYPAAAAEVAQRIADQYGDHLQRAIMLSRYFTDTRGYTYTEKPGKMRATDDVVSKLMKEKRGHCVYYATTLATMTRAAGIPSRLAAGYRTVWNEAEQAYVADASEPYAWVECYFRNLGWISFDATPRKRTDKLAPVPQVSETQTEKPSMEDQDQPNPDAPEESRLVMLRSLPGWLWWLVLLGLLGLRTAAAWWLYRETVAVRVFPDRRRRGEFYYQDILRQLERLGSPRKPQETLLEWLDRLEAAPENPLSAAVRPTLQPMLAMHYGARTPTQEEVTALAQLHGELEQQLRRQLPLPQYVLMRLVLRRVLSRAVLRPVTERKNA